MKKALIVPAALILLTLISCTNIQSAKPVDSSEYKSIPKLLEPIMITSFGQSIDIVILEGILDNLKINYTSEPKAIMNQFSQYKTIIVVVGSSKKGLIFSNTTLKDELDRIERIKKTIPADTSVVLIHMGGASRRGNDSDEIIKNSLFVADSILVVSDGNSDGLFSKYAQKSNIWFKEVMDLSKLQEELGDLIQ